MAKITVTLSASQAATLSKSLTSVPKPSKTTEALNVVVGEAITAAGEDAKKVPVTLSAAQGAAIVKALGTLPKQTKAVEALVTKFTPTEAAEG